MSFELDHIFVCTDAGAPQGQRLIELGLTEGLSRTHAGQGSANRCFFFHNAFLELIWVHDEAEAQSPLTSPIRLYERWNNRGKAACPFGLCFRPRDQHAASLPFQGWDYAPRYMPASRSIHIATNSDRLTEPMLFYLQRNQRPDTWPVAQRPPLTHRLGLREITRLRWLRPHNDSLSPELQTVVDAGQLQIGFASTHLLEIGFDGERAGEAVSPVPELPVTLHW